VCGGRSLDLEALQGATRYDDGLGPDHPLVAWFWEVRTAEGRGSGPRLTRQEGPVPHRGPAARLTPLACLTPSFPQPHPLPPQIAHSFDEAQRKRLLFFITGSDRVPIKGLAHLAPPFTISRNGGHSARLPTAHTCFNHLLLPGYCDKETLRARLLLAIENAEGFGLM
jgi:hypothetical protein